MFNVFLGELGNFIVKPYSKEYVFTTEKSVPKVGFFFIVSM
jgi:hypothetical protein